MRTKDRTRAMIGTMAAVLLATLLVPGLAAPALGTGAAPNPGAAPEVWAYGAVHYRNTSLNGTNVHYTASAFFGWTVVYTLTSTSNTSFELEAQRTMGVRYSAELCAPTCASPRASLGVTIRGFERETGFTNLTTTGSVDENGSASPALAITDSHSEGVAFLNESLAMNRTIAGVSRAFASDLTVGASATTQVAFSGSLGVIPWNVAPGVSWTSAANFTAQGSYRTGFNWSIAGNNGTGAVARNGTGGRSNAINTSGTVGLVGSDLGNLTLRNGVSAPVIVLGWAAGPFDGVDGVILVPRGFEVFGSGFHAWAAETQGIQTVTTSRLDLSLDRVHHRVQFVAAAATYEGTDTLQATGSASGAITAVPSTAASGDLVQAQPLSVVAAQTTNSCLAAGCPTSSGGASPTSRLIPLIVVGLVVVAVVGAVGTVEYRRMLRRREERRVASGYANQTFLNGAPAPYAYPPPLGPVNPPPGSVPPTGPSELPRPPHA